MKKLLILSIAFLTLGALMLIIGMEVPVDIAGLKFSVSQEVASSGGNLFDVFKQYTLLKNNGLLVNGLDNMYILIQVAIAGFSFMIIGLITLLGTVVLKYK